MQAPRLGDIHTDYKKNLTRVCMSPCKCILWSWRPEVIWWWVETAYRTARRSKLQVMACIACTWSCQKSIHGLEEGPWIILNSLQLPLPSLPHHQTLLPHANKAAGMQELFSESAPSWWGKMDQAIHKGFCNIIQDVLLTHPPAT